MKRAMQFAGCLLVAGCAGFGGQIADSDVDMMGRTLQFALEIDDDDVTRTWRNEQTGNSGAITPLFTYVGESGLFCRDYRDLQVIGGVARTFESRACRIEVGRWVYIEDIAGTRAP